MKNKKKLLIVLEKLDCGGVETYVYSQLNFFKKYFEVIVVAGDGLILNKIKNEGFKCYEIDFLDISLKNRIVNNNIFSKIIEIEKPSFAIIHPYLTYLIAIDQCIKNKIPYSLIIHDVKPKEYWDHFNKEVYKFLNKVVFKYSRSNIFVSIGSMNKYSEIFQLNIKKSYVFPNLIDTNKFNNKTNIESLSNFLIISRLDSDKKESVINAINCFNKLYLLSKNDNLILKIAGTGNASNDILKHTKKLESKNKIFFLGNVFNTNEIIENSDVVFGMGRVALEVMAMKRIFVLSGYDGLKGIICKDNLNNFMKTNFSGRDNNSISEEEIVNDLLSIDLNSFYKCLRSNRTFINNERSLNNSFDIYRSLLFIKGRYSLFKYLFFYRHIYSSNKINYYWIK